MVGVPGESVGTFGELVVEPVADEGLLTGHTGRDEGRSRCEEASQRGEPGELHT